MAQQLPTAGRRGEEVLVADALVQRMQQHLVDVMASRASMGDAQHKEQNLGKHGAGKSRASGWVD